MAIRAIQSPAGAKPAVVFAEAAGPGFLLTPLLPGPVMLFGVAFVANSLRRPWGVGPWPRFMLAAAPDVLHRRRPASASPEAPGMAASPPLPTPEGRRP